MFNMSENYNLRQFYLQHNQVPSQSVMREKMTPALASVYFRSMGPKYKILAGLEPPLKGGVTDWFVCPKTVLEGKTVLKPIHHKHVTKINHHGVVELGTKAFHVFKKDILAEKKKMLTDSDNKWKYIVNSVQEDYWQETAEKHKLMNLEYIREIFKQFSSEYQTSLNKIEQLLIHAARTEIERVRKEAFEKMDKRYRLFLNSQIATVTDVYGKKLFDEQTRLKTEFIEKLEINKAETANTIHDLNVDKHEAIANLKRFLECQNLACQIYVSLKEQENCDKEIELSKYQHKKKLKTLTDDLAVEDFTVKIAEEIEKKQQEELDQRRQKICKVVKRFQLFASYCLSTLPEHAEFFINTEKLMLLQINETLQNPCAHSIIIEEPKEFNPSTPTPRPFYLFCDRGYRAQVNQDLCPTNCASKASQLPVIVVNQRCMYAACDNFNQFPEMAKNHILGKRGDDADIADDLNYDHYCPVKYNTSQQLKEMKLESSLLQILQQEATSREERKCESCGMPSCYCTNTFHKKEVRLSEEPKKEVPSPYKTLGPSTILEHEREPKLERYLKYVEPQKCTCRKMAQKHLKQNLPSYMTNTSKYEDLKLLNYEKCPVSTLKQLVKQANGQIVVSPPVQKVVCQSKNVSTQYSDIEFDWLCTCFSNSNVDLLLKDYIFGQKLCPKPGESSRMIVDTLLPSYLQQPASSFATDRAQSLRQLLNKSPELQEIFRRKQC